jgi:flagellar basal-body rod protein FlgG
MEPTFLDLAASGLRAQQTRLDLVAHNLANLQTPGFRSFRAELVDLPADPNVFGLTTPLGLTTADAPTRGVQVARTLQPDRAGAPVPTGAPLDLALPDGVYLAVQLPGGQTAYTRDGHLGVTAQGTFQVGTFPLAMGARLQPGDGAPAVDASGRIVATGPNGPRVVGSLPLVRFANPEGLLPLGNGVLAATAESGPPQPYTPAGSDRLVPGALEASNVDLAQELTTLIRAQRAYQLNAQMVRTWDELAGGTIQDLGHA